MNFRERIADAILASRLGFISQATGIPAPTIARFLMVESDELPEDLKPVAEKLAAYFRLPSDDDEGK